MLLGRRCIIVAASLCLISTASGQPESVLGLAVEEVRSELDDILANEFNRATEWDQVTVALRRITSLYNRRPAAAIAQFEIPASDMEVIHSVFEFWRGSADPNGDNRISKMCEIWDTTNFTGADRIDAALLAYEREISSGFADYNRQRVEQLLSELELRLPSDSWERLSTLVNEYAARSSGSVSHSFFTKTVRASQSEETMELHCGDTI